MITVKIWGGLGNQLFQYAFGYMLSQEYNDILQLDIQFYDKQYSYVGKRKFYLDKLMCNINVAPKRTGLTKLLELWTVNRVLQKIPRSVDISMNQNAFHKEKKKKYDPNVLFCKNKNNYYDGYWQTAKYFEKYRYDLINMFQYSGDYSSEVLSFANKIDSCESVSVHIRRGDFTFSDKVGHLMDLSYYYDAISYMKKKLKNPIFVIFSDDITWVKDNLSPDKNIVYADYKCPDQEIIDLMLMKKCKHGIMSASTFSWWGNWLKAVNEDTIVIAPVGNYFNNKFIENDWIRI